MKNLSLYGGRAAIVIASVLPLASAWAVPAKATFTSKKYGFSPYLPQQPKAGTRSLPPQFGGGTMDTYATSPAPVSYSIVPLILPAALANVPKKSYVDGVQIGIIQSSNGKAVSSRDLKVNGQNVRSFVWTFSVPTGASKAPVKFSGETRIYKIGTRAYQFTALVPTAQYAASRPQIDKVLGSIQITQ